MGTDEQNQILSKFFAGEELDATKINPLDFDGWRATIAAMLKRGDKPDEIIKLLTPTQVQELFQCDPNFNPREIINAKLSQRWNLFGAGDLLKPPKKPDYLIHGMIRKPALICYYGVPGGLKTMIAMDQFVCVASGQTWLDPLPNIGEGGSYRVKQSTGLWLDMDNGIERLRERFGALSRGRGITDPPIHAVSLPRPIFDASNRQEAELLAAQIEQLKAGICVVDNLGTVSGGRDENSSQMVDVMANLRWIAESTGAVIFVIHHARKGLAGGRDGDRLRGHSSIEASLDLALLVERNGDDLTIRSTKTRDNPVNPFVVKWTFEKNSDDALYSARFWHIGSAEPDTPQYLTAGDELPDIIKNLEENPSQNKLCKILDDTYGLKKPQAIQAIKHAVSNGNIIEISTGNSKTSKKIYKSL